MTRIVAAETSPTEDLETDTSPEPVNGSWIVAALFWIALLVAGGMYAAVALSPKLVAYFNLRNDHYRTQVKLVTLQRRVTYLKRVMQALENDPEFAAEQARVELGAGRPGDERIEVDSRWHFSPDSEFDPSAFRKNILPWYLPILKVLATNEPIRRGLLIAAACLSLFAFTFLQESQTPQWLACARTMKSGWQRATSRYRNSSAKSHQENSHSSDSARANAAR